MPLTRKQTEAVNRFVGQLEVGPGGYVSFKYDFEQDAVNPLYHALADPSPWTEPLDRWEFLSLLQTRLRRFENRTGDYVGPLAGYRDKTIAEDIAKELISYFNSLPRPYFVCFQVDRFPRLGKPEVVLGAGVSLIDTSSGFNESIVEQTKGLRKGLDRLKRDTIYLRFEVNGYLSNNVDSHALSRGIAKLKHFVFLGVRAQTLTEQMLSDIFLSGMGKAPTLPDGFVYNRNEPLEASRFELPDQLAEYLRWLGFDEEKLQVTDLSGKTGATILTAPSKPATTPDEIASALRSALGTPIDFLDIPDDESDAERLRAAIEWAVDAKATSNETLAFLQRCIGLEAVLGTDDDRTQGVTDRLSDRYAYLLGTTQSQREKLKKEFEAIYKQRSGIVHSRRARIKLDYRTAAAPEAMLSNVIGKEVGSLLRNIRKRKEAAKP